MVKFNSERGINEAQYWQWDYFTSNSKFKYIKHTQRRTLIFIFSLLWFNYDPCLKHKSQLSKLWKVGQSDSKVWRVEKLWLHKIFNLAVFFYHHSTMRQWFPQWQFSVFCCQPPRIVSGTWIDGISSKAAVGKGHFQWNSGRTVSVNFPRLWGTLWTMVAEPNSVLYHI